MTEHVHIDFESDPIEAGDEFCRVCNPNPQYVATIDAGGGGGGGGVGFYVQDTEPATTFPGMVWKDTFGGVGNAAQWWERNAADTGWDAAFYQVARTATDDANVGSSAYNSGSGNALAGASAVHTGSGDATTSITAETVAGSGYADVSVLAESGAGAEGSVSLQAKVGGVIAGMRGWTDSTTPHLAFNGVTPIPVPVVPLTIPSVQNVIDALVALGLITQSD